MQERSLTLGCAGVQTAANLMTDDLLMRTAQLTPEYRPLVDFHNEYSPTQARQCTRHFVPFACAARTFAAAFHARHLAYANMSSWQAGAHSGKP